MIDDETTTYALTNELGFCGCGEPESALEFVRRVLQALALRSDPARSDESHVALNAALGDDPGRSYLLLYWLDMAKLVDHGVGIRHCWLSIKGQETLANLDAWAARRETGMASD